MSGSVSCGVTALSPRSRCTQGFVCAHQESLFLQSWGSSIIKSCWPSKSDSWGFPVPLLELQVGKSIVGPRTFATLRELVWYNCAAASGLPTTWLYGRATGSVVGLTVTSFRRTNATLCGSQACYCRGPCPHGKSLLTHASTGDPDAHRQVWLSLLWGSLLLSRSPGAHTVVFVPLKSLWWVWGLILMLPLLPSCCSFSFVLECGKSFFFFVGSNILLSMVVQQIAAILVFSQKMSTLPSTLPSSMAVQPKVLFCFLLYGSVAIFVSASYSFITKT